MASHCWAYLRLAGFPLGFGITTVLVSGTLNRVMIVEYDLPASVVGLFFAIPLLIAPTRVWLGYVSDGYPIRGKRREPYILIGALVAAMGVVGATLMVTHSEAAGVVLISGALLAFLAYGMGSNLASNTFEALLADKFVGEQRPRAVTIFKVVMFVGILAGAVALGQLLDPFEGGRFAVIVIGTMMVISLLTAGAIVRQEPHTHRIRTISREAAAVSFRQVIHQMIWADPQARRFFLLVMLTVLGTLAQDVLLEPYGALVLDMSVSQTTRLTAIWGTGTILAMMGGGVWLIKRLGHRRVLRWGLVMNSSVFGGMILAGAMHNTGLFMGLVFLLGAGTGLAASGLLTAVIEYTTVKHAGLLMGVWGLAHEVGQALGGMMGGVVVDVVQRATDGDHLVAYGTVFAAEGLLLIVALVLLRAFDLDVLPGIPEAAHA